MKFASGSRKLIDAETDAGEVDVGLSGPCLEFGATA